MRKLWYAGAVAAGGILLCGTAALADRSSGLNVEKPAPYRTAGGLLPDGLAIRRTEPFKTWLPLLGGLGGLPPSNALPPSAPGLPDLTGLPPGGMPVAPAATSPSTAPHREFSPNGRPVAGVDEQYK